MPDELNLEEKGWSGVQSRHNTNLPFNQTSSHYAGSLDDVEDRADRLRATRMIREIRKPEQDIFFLHRAPK